MTVKVTVGVRVSLARIAARFTAAVTAAVLGVAVAGAPALAADNEYVQYYAVTSASENLGAIAERLLHDSGRSAEIFKLNAGRRQPDGGSLTDQNKLRAGWYLVLPWDADGPGVQYGFLPTKAPAASGTGTSADKGGSVPDGKSASGPAGQAAKPTGPPTAPGGGSATRSPAGVVPKTPPPPSTGKKCVAATVSSRPSNWAMTRLAADQAWKHSRGTGQLVAVVDSGVDGRAAQLSGRVAIGANIVTGDGRGDSDCMGTGTAMAGLVAAEPLGELTFAGVAPEAVVMPVRVVTDGRAADPAGQAAAIEVAVSAGATVVALGSHVDVTQAPVAQAIKAALEHNIVVVAGAPVRGGRPAPLDGAVLVGGVAENGKPAAAYAPKSVDVVAPGMNVSSIGINGTKTFVGSGTQYAVALTAGTAALVRSSHPELTGKQVAHRLTATTEKMAGAQADGWYGSGMVSPVAAVTQQLPEETTAAAGAAAGGRASGGGGARLAFVLTVLVGLLLSALLVFRFRGTMRRASAGGVDELDNDWPAGPVPGEANDSVSSATGSR
ncbi:S8 family serine peptidase [Actinoplanes sp. NPDC051470]|uniref:S8 family serine peptidase n=1 Tax=Actinoplanes sp. NPDC051470 TaxID=3157224 RepID=UPI003433123A